MNIIQEDYVSYEVAKLLKEKGFVGECNMFEERVEKTFGTKWNTESKCRIPIPTLQMAMKWLREIHKINIDIKSRWKLNPYKLDYYYFVLHYKNVPSDSFIIKFDSYEEAVEAALKYTLENLV